MAFVWDPIYALNLILCILILILGFVGWRNLKDKTPLYIGIAFGLFGISHTAFLLGLSKALSTYLIIIRLCAYIIVVFALWQLTPKK
jgi:hypothetical protein